MLTDIQIDFVLKDLLDLYGHDFNYYSRDSFDRRINRLFKLEKFASYEAFSNKLKNDKNYIDHFIDSITVNVTEMFRDPEFFITLRREVIPNLAHKTAIRIWHAGCSTGEEAYSIAILMEEAGLLDKCEILATDINAQVLERARHGRYASSLMPPYEKNYHQSGCTDKLASYFDLVDSTPQLKSRLKEKVRFVQHNLACGISPGTFDLVICRNVLIYFDRSALKDVFDLFYESTSALSYLALGEKETLQFSHIDSKYTRIGKERIWKKNF